jgi:hypothetical protein
VQYHLGDRAGAIYDYNGNIVGHFDFIGDLPAERNN